MLNQNHGLTPPKNPGHRKRGESSQLQSLVSRCLFAFMAVLSDIVQESFCASPSTVEDLTQPQHHRTTWTWYVGQAIAIQHEQVTCWRTYLSPSHYIYIYIYIICNIWYLPLMIHPPPPLSVWHKVASPLPLCQPTQGSLIWFRKAVPRGTALRNQMRLPWQNLISSM